MQTDRTFDALIFDLQLQEADGLALLKDIQAAYPELPLVVLTVRGQQITDPNFSGPMVITIPKPIRVEELIEALKRVPLQAQVASLTEEREPTTESEPHSGSGPLDMKVLDEFEAILGKGGAEVVIELLSLFLEDSPKLLHKLEVGLEQADAAALQQAAHTFKSTAGHLGAVELARLCLELEAVGYSGDISGASELVARIFNEYERVEAYLKEELSRREPV